MFLTRTGNCRCTFLLRSAGHLTGRVTLLITEVGFMGGWSSPYSEKLTSPESTIKMSRVELSWVVSLLNLGRLLGAISGSLCVNYLGSKTSLLASAVPTAMCWVFVVIADNVWWLYGSRFLGGLSLGMLYSSFSLYLGEVADPSIRGTLVAMSMGGVPIGTFVMSTMGAYLSMDVSAAICLGPCLIAMILFLWMPESPHHLITNEQYEKAKLSIQWYHRGCDVETEFASLKKFIDSYSGRTFLETLKEFKTPCYKKSMLLILFLFAYSQVTGVNNVFFYMEAILKNAQVTMIQPSIAVVIILGVGIIGPCGSMILMDRFGRKLLMIVSSIGAIISLCSLSLVFHLLRSGFQSTVLEGLSIISVLCLYINVFLGILSTPPTILSELFPSHLKCIAACFASCVAGISSFISAFTYLPLLDLLTELYVFFFYALFILFGLPVLMYCVPETKGLSLQEIQRRLVKKQ
ncbi:facilitated trehalose transporter Tret1 isoform X1 [Nomia melanderi]|uniref:facilitated trehalose transporter Tret1 isoform X1 n=1 Tax=Nomia melanderi TaxID=2448451 RepID=UPI003FCE5A95